MEATEAIEKAMTNEDVKKLKSYFLCSCFACIKGVKDSINEWTLMFYNPHTNKIVDCFVNDRFVTVGEETLPLKEVEEADFGHVAIRAGKALDAVSKKFSKSTINVLITLHRKPPVWTINMITPDMTATTFDIDAKSGRITREETTSLVRRL